MLRAALAALLILAPIATPAAIFNDGNDRKLVKDLRAKDPATLTSEEKAVLAAANKVGTIGLCGGRFNGNAFVIKHKACPANGAAVATSGHMLVDDNGKLKCSLEEARNPDYLPNRSYFYGEKQRRDKWVMKMVDIRFPPVNWAELEGGNLTGRSEDDIAVFCLAEDITNDPMPEGTKRGHFRFGTEAEIDGKLFMLGLRPTSKTPMR